jgi:hypothetical protein
VHLLKQAPVVLRHADDRSGAAPLPRQALEQPGAERVELAHLAHIDGDALGLRRLGLDPVDEAFELAGSGRGPGTRRFKLELAVLEFGRQQ